MGRPMNMHYVDLATACNNFLTPLVVGDNKIDDKALDEIATKLSIVNICRI